MTTKSKIKRVRWMAALTLVLLFLPYASPFFFDFVAVRMPEFNGINRDRALEWDRIYSFILIFLHAILLICIVVFFVRMLRGLGRGKIFVPSNARWLYIGAWLPFPFFLHRGLSLMLFGASSQVVTSFVIHMFSSVWTFSAITLMALLYDVATDVSEENQLTV